ncbi:E2F-associated phosphoprotein-like [Argopecten irradians]|uniref:E2F-associated phosphoprotein-like n=1 Tax=Argopecten irradians TaxID=31199 RepID=UPI0037246352
MIKMDIDCDYIDFRDDSDPCVGSDSSSDEGGLDIVLNGTPELKRKLTVRCSRKPELSSEDEFEKEMNEELNDTVKAMEAARSGKKTGKKFKSEAGSSTSRDEKKEPESYYDDVYFDSDEEEMVTQECWVDSCQNVTLWNAVYDQDEVVSLLVMNAAS